MTPKHWLIAAACVWGATGLIEPHLPDAGEPLNAIGAVQAVLTGLCFFGWCKAHARAQAITAPAGAALLTALFAPIGLPYYAFRGFGFRRGIRLIGWAIVTLIGLSATYVACFMLSGWLRYEVFA